LLFFFFLFVVRVCVGVCVLLCLSWCYGRDYGLICVEVIVNGDCQCWLVVTVMLKTWWFCGYGDGF
jgi:hypothetical protein